MEMITRAKFEKSGQGVNEPVLKQMSEAIERQLDRESTAIYGSARLWDDGIVDPRDTRKILSLCLSIAGEGDARVLHPNSFGVADSRAYQRAPTLCFIVRLIGKPLRTFPDAL